MTKIENLFLYISFILFFIKEWLINSKAVGLFIELGSRHLIRKSLNSFEIWTDLILSNSICNSLFISNNLYDLLFCDSICSKNLILSKLFFIPMNISRQIIAINNISYLKSCFSSMSLTSLLVFNFWKAFSKLPIFAFPSFVRRILVIFILLLVIFNWCKYINPCKISFIIKAISISVKFLFKIVPKSNILPPSIYSYIKYIFFVSKEKYEPW